MTAHKLSFAIVEDAVHKIIVHNAELEAALAERERMLDFVNPWRRQENKDKWLAHLRARAEEGTKMSDGGRA